MIYILAAFLSCGSFNVPAIPLCGTSRDFSDRIDAALEGNHPAGVIDRLENLKNDWENCHLAKDSTFARLYHILGRYYWESGNIEKGLTYTRTAIGVNSETSPAASGKALANSFFNMGAMYAQKGEINAAVEAYRQAIAIGSRHDDKQFIVAKAYKELASILFGQGDLGKSVLAAEKGFAVSRKLGDSTLMAENLIEKSQSLIALEALAEAETSLQSAKLLGSENQRLLAAIYSLFAEYHVKKEQIPAAISNYEISYRHFVKSGFLYGCGQASVNLGYLYAERAGNYKTALECYQRALGYFQAPQDKAIARNAIAGVYRKMGAGEQALAFNQHAIREFLQAPVPRNRYENPEAKHIRQVVDKTNLLDMVVLKGHLLLSDYETRGETPSLKAALATYMLADTMIDFMRWEHVGTVSKLFWRNKTRDVYEHAIRTSYLLNDPEKAFFFFEKSRAALLQDQINELGANALLPEKERIKERQLQSRINELLIRLSSEDGGEAQKGSLRASLYDAQEALQHFAKRVEGSHPAYFAYKYGQRISTLKNLRDHVLGSNQGFLSYFIGEKFAYGFYCDGTSASLREIDFERYQETVRDFERYLLAPQLQNQDFKAYLKTSFQLFALLIQPFGVTEGKRLVISPDGKFLPFASLSRNADKEDFLVRHSPVSYAYSASFLASKHTPATKQSFFRTFFGMAPVAFSPELGQASLPGSDKAVNKLGRQFLFPKILSGKAASKSAFLMNMAQFPVVHLFTHASAASEHMSKPAPVLYFSDSVTTLSELDLPYRPATKLIVLSACETGVGVDQSGEGVFSLARIFAGAGIPSTLTTLWKIESRSAYQVSSWFYEGLCDGLPLDCALQQAQLKWLNSSDKTEQLPYQWAGTVLIGKTGKISAGPHPMTMWLILAVVVLAAFAMGYGSRLMKRNNTGTSKPVPKKRRFGLFI